MAKGRMQPHEVRARNHETFLNAVNRTPLVPSVTLPAHEKKIFLKRIKEGGEEAEASLCTSDPLENRLSFREGKWPAQQ